MQLTIREPGSAITHFIGCLMALIAASPLLIKAHGNATYMLAMTIFATSMVLLYAASTIYHSICHVSAKVLRNFQKLDHMMIFVLIAGSYTPVCMIILGGRIGYTLLALVWGIAVAGIIVKVICLDIYEPLSIYTIGGVIYALKLPVFNALHKYFGSHEIFHLFVMGGSVCHFIFMYHYVI